jgi:hypothetical protein
MTIDKVFFIHKPLNVLIFLYFDLDFLKDQIFFHFGARLFADLTVLPICWLSYCTLDEKIRQSAAQPVFGTISEIQNRPSDIKCVVPGVSTL